MNINYSNLDSIFADAGTDMLTLGDIIENREIMSEHALKEAGKLFLSEMYKGKGPRPNISEWIKNYAGPITEEMTKICIRKTSAGYKCRCNDFNIITPLRSQLKHHNKTSKDSGRYKIYNSLAEYFEDVTNSISLYVFYKCLRGNSSFKFTDETYRNIAMGFAKELELQSFFDNFGLTDKILKYQGPILKEFKKVELYRTPKGIHLRSSEDVRNHTCTIMKNWKNIFVLPKTKICSCCGRELPAAAFSKDMHRCDMLSVACKECKNKRANKNKEPNIDKHIENKYDVQNEPKSEGVPATIPIITPAEIYFDLSKCPVQDILQELRNRGYTGEISLRI